MIHLPDPILNGYTITHEELRALHANMRVAVHSATKEACLDGPRLLDSRRGEYYSLRARGRDRNHDLLAEITVTIPWACYTYTRRIRLVRAERLNLFLSQTLARD
jgi:hypothetical protein